MILQTLLMIMGAAIIAFFAWLATRPKLPSPWWPKILRSHCKPTLNHKGLMHRSVAENGSKDRSEKGYQHPLVNAHLGSCSMQEISLQTALVKSEDEAFFHLENSQRIIEKQFFPSYQEGASRLIGGSLIDQRTFWDCFRSEQKAVVMLYQIDEGHPIFVSTSIKKLLGYSVADFRIRFHEIIYDELAWQRMIEQLRWRTRLYAPLAFRDASALSGSGICAWDGYFSLIDRGNGAHFAVALLYPAYCYLPRPSLMKS